MQFWLVVEKEDDKAKKDARRGALGPKEFEGGGFKGGWFVGSLIVGEGFTGEGR